MANTGPSPGYLLVSLAVGAVSYRISTEIVALDHLWDAQIISFDAPHYALDKIYGGYCRMGLGDIVLFPTIFQTNWPPPIQLEIVCQYTATTEAEATTFFSGTIHLRTFDRESVTYDFYGPNEDVDLLEEGADYNGDTVAYPRAFGSVVHQPALRLADAGGGNQRYHMAHIVGTVLNCGDGDVWCVYDDGVDISGNVTNVSGNVFELTAAPVGEVTITGVSADTSLALTVEVFCGASYLNYTYNDDFARVVSPVISHYAISQTKVVDFLSEICAACTHLFYVLNTTLYLVDMLLDNGERTTDEFDFFPLTYSYHPPLKSISSSWDVRESFEGRTSGVETTQYVRVFTEATSVFSDYAYGNGATADTFSITKATIETRLADILAIVHKPFVNWRIPLQGSLPVPGEKISWVDESLIVSTNCYIRARSIKFDFDIWEILIEGEGVIT